MCVFVGTGLYIFQVTYLPASPVDQPPFPPGLPRKWGSVTVQTQVSQHVATEGIPWGPSCYVLCQTLAPQVPGGHNVVPGQLGAVQQRANSGKGKHSRVLELRGCKKQSLF